MLSMVFRQGVRGVCVSCASDVYIYTSHSQFEHDKRGFIQEAEDLNIRIHMGVTGDAVWGMYLSCMFLHGRANLMFWIPPNYF